MDQPNESILKDTPTWIFQVWTAFVLSFGASLVGIAYLPLAIWAKGFVSLAYVFTVSSAFTLAKTIRDNHESRRLINRIAEAKAERILREYEMPPSQQAQQQHYQATA